MSARGYYKPRQPGSLKEAVAELVAACGGVEAARSRVGKTVIQQATDPAHPARHLAVDVVLDLERQARSPVVSRYLAFEAGYLCVALPAVENEPYPLALAKITTETGALLSAGGNAMRDGSVTTVEAQLLKREALRVAAACAALVADCDAVLVREAHK